MMLDRTREVEICPDAVSFTALIRGLCESKRMDDVMKMLDCTRLSRCSVVHDINSCFSCESKRMDNAYRSDHIEISMYTNFQHYLTGSNASTDCRRSRYRKPARRFRKNGHEGLIFFIESGL